MKRVLLGMLLIGSMVFGAKAYDTEPECLGLEGDFKQYDEIIIQLQRVANINAILKDGSKNVELLEYCREAQAYILHIVKKHEDYLSKDVLSNLADDNDRLAKMKSIMTGN